MCVARLRRSKLQCFSSVDRSKVELSLNGNEYEIVCPMENETA